MTQEINISLDREIFSRLIQKSNEADSRGKAFAERRDDLFALLKRILLPFFNKQELRIAYDNQINLELKKHNAPTFCIRFNPPYSDYDILIESDRRDISNNLMRVKMRLVETTGSTSINSDHDIEVSFPLYETILSEDKINLMIVNIFKMLERAW